MKTPSDLEHEYMRSTMTPKQLIEARDAEHRAELDETRERLQSALNANVMCTALIERLRGELAEAKRDRDEWSIECTAGRLREAVLRGDAAPPPAESTPVCTACPGPALLGVCSHPGCEVNKESREVGRMMRENDKDGLATYLNRNVAAKAKRAVERINAAPPDDIRERLEEDAKAWAETALRHLDRLDDHDRRLAALEAKGEPGTHCCVAERCTEGGLP